MQPDDIIDGECVECERLLETLSQFLDGELSDELRRDVVIHAQECSRCSQLLYSLRRLVTYCHTEPNCEMPNEVRQQLWITIREELRIARGVNE